MWPKLVDVMNFIRNMNSYTTSFTYSLASWWKKVFLAPLLPRIIFLLVNMYEKFVLPCLSRQISG